MKKRLSITVKLTMGVIVFGVLLGVICGVVGYSEFTSVLEQQYNDAAYEVAEAALTMLNPDQFEQYLETGQTDEEYDRVQAQLDALVNATNTTLIYVKIGGLGIYMVKKSMDDVSYEYRDGQNILKIRKNM